MEKKIITLPRFEKNASNIYDYLLNEFSAKVAYEFLHKLGNRINFIAQNPYTGQPSQKKKNVRSVTLFPHNKIYYRIKDNIIDLLCIVDMRRDNSRNQY